MNIVIVTRCKRAVLPLDYGARLNILIETLFKASREFNYMKIETLQEIIFVESQGLFDRLDFPVGSEEALKRNLDYLTMELEIFSRAYEYNKFVRKYLDFLHIPPSEFISYPSRVYDEFLIARRKALAGMALTRLSSDILARPKVYVKPAVLQSLAERFIEYWEMLPLEPNLIILSEINPITLEERDFAIMGKLIRL